MKTFLTIIAVLAGIYILGAYILPVVDAVLAKVAYVFSFLFIGYLFYTVVRNKDL